MFRPLYGLIFVAIGTGMVINTEPIFRFFGAMDFADSWIPFYGGSRLGYKLIGIGLIIIGLMLITGLLQPALLYLFAPLFRGLGPAVPAA